MRETPPLYIFDIGGPSYILDVGGICDIIYNIKIMYNMKDIKI